MPVKWTTWKKGTNLPRINQEEIENMSSLITSNEIETVIKNLPTNRSPGLDGSTGKSYQTFQFSSVQFSSVAHSCPTLCDPMNRNTPGLPVHQQLLKFTQTHVHRVGDAIQPSHPLLSPSPPAFNLSQHQGLFPVSWLFASGGQSIGASASASVLPMNSQD